MKKLFRATIVFTLLSLLLSCSQHPAARGPTNEQGLATLTHSAFDKLAIRASTDFSQYRRFKIETLTVSYDNTRRIDLLNRKNSVFEFDQRELALFNKQFSKGLTKAWGKRFGWKLTEETGADVIVVCLRHCHVRIVDAIVEERPTTCMNVHAVAVVLEKWRREDAFPQQYSAKIRIVPDIEALGVSNPLRNGVVTDNVVTEAAIHEMRAVGFEPTRTEPKDLKSFPLDHSGKHATKGAAMQQPGTFFLVARVVCNNTFH